jgi:antirestriction protein
MAQYIDTRDLAGELDDLEARQDAVAAFVEELETTDEQEIAAAVEVAEDLDPLTEEEQTRLSELRDLADEIGDEWRYGATMIPEDDFAGYAQELAEDCGMVPHGVGWPVNHIDWEAAADELRIDYTEVEWEGTTYLVRT